MSKLDSYRERECYWRDEAWRHPPGPDREVCMAIADGYASLISECSVMQAADERWMSPQLRPDSF